MSTPEIVPDVLDDVQTLYLDTLRLISLTMRQGFITSDCADLRRDYLVARYHEVPTLAEKVAVCNAIIGVCTRSREIKEGVS